jgi:tRNA dimethylallyltransferase
MDGPPDPFESALILTGPTASGKTALSLELAERLNAEIVAMDSMTLYRKMDIGTAKPTPEERSVVPHHLLDLLEPWESANVAWWLDRAREVVREISARGKQVLFVGGTPFYLKALLHGLFEAPPVDADLRRRLEKEAAEVGPLEFHRKLQRVDPASANRLHPNDVRRVVRALEVFEQTGVPLSQVQRQGWFDKSATKSDEGRFPRCLALDWPREELCERISQRVEQQIRSGWLDEVRELDALPNGLSKEASQALGYREIASYLRGERTLPETVEIIQTRTRQFAKRQMTWFRNLSGCLICSRKLTFELWRERMN